MKQYAHWVPAIFCAFLSLIAVAGLISMTAGYGDWWGIAYYSFLPMCFYFGGAVMGQSRREIQELRQQIIELKQQGGH